MTSDRSLLRLDVSHLSGYAQIALVWSGAVNVFISSRFGGFVYIALTYGCFVAMFISGNFRYAYNTRPWKCFLWTGIFCIVYFIGMEVFAETQYRNNLFGFSVSRDSYYLLKNAPCWLTGILIISNTDKRYCRRVFLLFLIVFIAGMLATIWATSLVPNFVRYSTTGGEGYDLYQFSRLGARGFELTYSAAIIVPALVVMVSKKSKLYGLLFLLLSIYYVIKCSLFLGIVALMMNMSLSCLLSINKRWLRNIAVIVTVIVCILALLNSDLLGKWLIMLSQDVNDRNISLRLNDLGSMLAYGDESGESLNRLDLYRSSLIGIGTSPVIGNFIFDGRFPVSGHSTILDVWCSFGLICIIPLFAMIWQAYKHSMESLAAYSRAGLIKAAYITCVFIASVNPALALPNIVMCVLFVIPLCVICGL